MSELKLTTISNIAGDKSVPSETVIAGSAKAWVNFTGIGTVTIRSAFNVSSVTDLGVGSYTINFATAMPDADYSTVFLTNVITNNQKCDGYNNFVNNVSIGTRVSGGVYDHTTISLSVFSN